MNPDIANRMRGGTSLAALAWCGLFTIVGLLLCVLLLNVYVGPDSLTYLRTARYFFSNEHNLASVQFPPLYPILLKSFIVTGASEALAAKLLNALLWIGSFLACTHILSSIDPDKKLHSMLIALVFMSCYVIFAAHTQMMSESLFMFLVFINIALLNRYAQDNAIRWLVLASVVASLAALSRYAGIAVMISTLLTLLWLSPERSLKQWFKTGILWGTSSLLFGLWLLRNNLLYNTFTGREVISHDRDFLGASHYVEVLSRLVFPRAVPESLRIVLFYAFIAVTVAGIIYLLVTRRQSLPCSKRTAVMATITLLVLAVQVALLVVALYVDPFLPVQQRILTPIFSVLLLLHLLLATYFLSTTRFKSIVVLYFVIFFLLNMARLLAFEVKADPLKYGYASAPYTDSPLVKYLQSESNDLVISSNGDDVIGWHLQREVIPLPKMTNPRTSRRNLHFEDELKALYCELKSNNGYLVYFSIIDWRNYLPSLETIQQTYLFDVVKTTHDGIVLKPSGPELGDNDICIEK